MGEAPVHPAPGALSYKQWVVSGQLPSPVAAEAQLGGSWQTQAPPPAWRGSRGALAAPPSPCSCSKPCAGGSPLPPQLSAARDSLPSPYRLGDGDESVEADQDDVEDRGSAHQVVHHQPQLAQAPAEPPLARQHVGDVEGDAEAACGQSWAVTPAAPPLPPSRRPRHSPTSRSAMARLRKKKLPWLRRLRSTTKARMTRALPSTVASTSSPISAASSAAAAALKGPGRCPPPAQPSPPARGPPEWLSHGASGPMAAAALPALRRCPARLCPALLPAPSRSWHRPGRRRGGRHRAGRAVGSPEGRGALPASAALRAGRGPVPLRSPSCEAAPRGAAPTARWWPSSCCCWLGSLTCLLRFYGFLVALHCRSPVPWRALKICAFGRVREAPLAQLAQRRQSCSTQPSLLGIRKVSAVPGDLFPQTLTGMRCFWDSCFQNWQET